MTEFCSLRKVVSIQEPSVLFFDGNNLISMNSRQVKTALNFDLLTSLKLHSDLPLRAIRKEVDRYQAMIDTQPKWARYVDRVRRLMEFAAQPKVVVMHTAMQAGFGLFAMEDIPKDSFVLEYIGLMQRIKSPFWSNVVGGKRSDYLASCDPVVCRPSFLGFSFKELQVDAEHYGNIARFINDAPESNVAVVMVPSHGLIHVALVARQDIYAGQQILWNYGEGYWSGRQRFRLNWNADTVRFPMAT